MMTVNPDYGKASMLGSHFPVPHSLFYANSTKLARFCPAKNQPDKRARRSEMRVLAVWWAFRRGRCLNSSLFSGTQGNLAIISTQNVLKMRRLDFVCPTCFIDEGI